MTRGPAMICVDMGTTRTRAWLVRGSEILARAAEDFGVRNLSGGERKPVEDALRELLCSVSANEDPACVIAAGMIGAPTGLHCVPHLASPAGVPEIIEAVAVAHLPRVTALPFMVVPGIKSGAEDILSSDVMRGEETMVMGLFANGELAGGDLVLNLGSHWKWIQTDAQQRIIASRTALTGEMIHAVQSTTLLASGLPQQRPTSFAAKWITSGTEISAREGLSRALFCVRLLELQGECTADERLAFLYGAFLQQELNAIESSPFFAAIGRPHVAVVGPSALAAVWVRHLRKSGWSARSITEETVERSYLAGLTSLAAQKG